MRRKRKPNAKQPSLNDDDSYGNTTSTSTSSISESNKFPSVLPQSTVVLELGVINMEPASSSKMPSDNDNLSDFTQQQQDTHQLIEMCRRWRESSRKTRSSESK